METIWLSHELDARTPLYGGGKGIGIISEKSMRRGDSCNTSRLELPGHAGSHVDAPAHFIQGGPTLSHYAASAWVFAHPALVRIDAAPGHLIGPGDLEPVAAISPDTDLLLLCTGFERYRGQETYWKEGPGIAARAASFLKTHLPQMQAIGFDFISLSSLAHREAGRSAHRAFLGAGLRIFEDLSFNDLDPARTLNQVIALPLRVAGADGAPCTVIGFVG